MNKLILNGNLGRDPDLNYAQNSGTAKNLLF